MDKLPSEVLDNIAAHLSGGIPLIHGKTGSLATISRQWQKHIEYRTFSDLSIRSDRLVEFLAIVSRPRRRYLRNLNFEIELHLFDIDSNNWLLTDALRQLFLALSVWNLGPNPPSLALPIDVKYTGAPETFWPSNKPVFDIFSVEDFPGVSLIRKLYFEWPTISDSSWIALASRLPNLEDLDAVINDKQKLDLAQRRKNRNKLTVTLSKMNTSNLVHFTLYSRRFGYERTQRPTSNVLLPDGVDYLSLELNRVMRSPHLRTFRICSQMALSPSIFHLPDDATWFPRLELIEIAFSPCAPDGERYFHGYMPEGGEEEVENYEENDYEDPEDLDDHDVFDNFFITRYCWTAASENLRPLLLAAARAIAHHRMPCLREFTLRGPDLVLPPPAWSSTRVEYVAPRVQYPLRFLHLHEIPDEPGSRRPRSYLRVHGLNQDTEIGKAWSMVRKGAVVFWNQEREFCGW